METILSASEFASRASSLAKRPVTDDDVKTFFQLIGETVPGSEDLITRMRNPKDWGTAAKIQAITKDYSNLIENMKPKTSEEKAENIFEERAMIRRPRRLDFREHVESPETFYSQLGELFDLVEVVKYNGFSPFDARDDIIQELGMDLVNRLIAIVANNSMLEDKLRKKRTKEGLREITQVLNDVSRHGKDLDLTPGRIVSAFCDLMFMFRCALFRNGNLKKTGDVAIPEPLNFLSCGSLINLDAWAEEVENLSKLLRKPGHVVSQGTLDVIRNGRSRWQQIFPDKAVALHLQYAYKIEQCSHHGPSIRHPKWGIFSTEDLPCCTVCLQAALNPESISLPGTLVGMFLIGK